MFKNSKGELVPHCGDCDYGDPRKDCPDNASIDQIDDERGYWIALDFRLLGLSEFE